MLTSENKTQTAAQAQASRQPTQGGGQHPAAVQITDHRPQAGLLRKLQTVVDHSPRVQQLVQLKERMNPQPVQSLEDKTGLPEQLKSGVEALSGMSMDHVRVHYNSPQPAQLNAHAYAQGSDIHVAPGEERHLPHEAWHVVQQAQGRVKPTLQMKQGVSVNDDAGLEREADVMGERALQSTGNRQDQTQAPPLHVAADASPVQRAERAATVEWGITHIVALADGSLFGGDNALDNELQPAEGGQLKKATGCLWMTPPSRSQDAVPIKKTAAIERKVKPETRYMSGYGY
jgi:hypothetical protein